MEIQGILTLIQAFTDHALTEMNVEDHGFKILLKKEHDCAAPQGGAAFDGAAGGCETAIQTPAPLAAARAASAAPAAPVMAPGIAGAGNAAAPPVQANPTPQAMESDKLVLSPLVGIFYSASSPGAEDFVKVGDIVKKGQVLGIIEAMKLMNEIESEHDGVVEAVLVKNEDVVEYNQPLFRIR